MDVLTAPAKLTLSLRITGVRDDGFHLIEAEMVTLDLTDTLTLTDGDGLFKIWGAAAKDKYAKMMPYIGQTVEITGTEVTLSNNYDVRSFDLQTVKRKTTK